MGALSPNPEDTHSTPVPGHAHRSHAARQGPGGREGAQFPAPCLQGRLSARGQWAFGGAGWACCWAALGACRRSGCSLVFSDAGELWALAQFATPIFPVQGTPGAEVAQRSEHAFRRTLSCAPQAFTSVTIHNPLHPQPLQSPLAHFPELASVSAPCIMTPCWSPDPSLGP